MSENDDEYSKHAVHTRFGNLKVRIHELGRDKQLLINENKELRRIIKEAGIDLPQELDK